MWNLSEPENHIKAYLSLVALVKRAFDDCKRLAESLEVSCNRIVRDGGIKHEWRGSEETVSKEAGGRGDTDDAVVEYPGEVCAPGTRASGVQLDEKDEVMCRAKSDGSGNHNESCDSDGDDGDGDDEEPVEGLYWDSSGKPNANLSDWCQQLRPLSENDSIDSGGFIDYSSNHVAPL